MHKDSVMAIITNDLDSLIHRIEACEAHEDLTAAMVATTAARDAMKKARVAIHVRDMDQRYSGK